jgi:hypothetical protein
MTGPGDTLTASGANNLASRVKSFWSEQGFVVRVWTVSRPIAHDENQYDVRSDLLNGLPRKMEKGAMNNHLPWEVQLLLMLADADYDQFETCLDYLIEQAEAGDMPAPELKRFTDAMRQVTEEHNRQFLSLTNLVEGKSKVTFKNGRWRVTD